MRKSEFYGMMQKTLLKVDRASMAHSLEVRVPFLKKSVIEASLKIDPLVNYADGSKKLILKTLLKNNLPNAPISNVKRGFTVPLRRWIKEDLNSTFKEYLYDKSMAEKFGFNVQQIETLMNIHVADKFDHKWPLFTIFSLYKWQEKMGR
jgi:asparagine synthase (glutamine-hydrolysing)